MALARVLEADLRAADAKSPPPEDIGLLTRPVEPEAWLSNLRARYAFLTALDDSEQHVARCDPGDLYKVFS